MDRLRLPHLRSLSKDQKTIVAAVVVKLTIVAICLSAAVAFSPAPTIISSVPSVAPTFAASATPTIAHAQSVAEVSPAPTASSPASPALTPVPASAPTPAPSAPATKKVAARTSVVVLGDSYETGWNGYGKGSKNWVAQVAKAMNWKVTSLSVAGTGFLNPGWTKDPFSARLERLVRAKPAVVIVAGGHNDARYAPKRSGAAADTLLRAIHKRLPKAQIVVIAPIWSNGNPPKSITLLRDHLRRTSRTIGATFIDPLAEGWFSGSAHRLISGDGIHPTDAGHRHIAKKVIADLKAGSEADR